MGAAIRGAKLSNLPSIDDINLFDVTNLSLGIKEYGNKFNIIIPRSTPIPYYNKRNFKTSVDNQTNALIKVYEGEEEKNCDKNLFLGKFMITGLPNKKKGKVKVEVKFEIKENSILTITAMDIFDKSNCKQLIIEKLNDFSDIMNELKERDNKISFYEDENYNNIKFSIIESEEEIRKLKAKNNINNENIKSGYKRIIENIGNFLIKCNDFSNLVISFIKFYFNKISEFYNTYQFDDEKDLNALKSNISILLEKVQLYKKDFIFEIIEESVDTDNIYKSFIDFIMQSLWDEINTIFYIARSAKEPDNDNDYEKALNDLSKGKSLIDVCMELIDKFDEKKIKLNNITKSDLKDVKLKINVREGIIKAKNTFYNDKNELKKLYNEYYECPSLDPEDLKELGQLIGIGISKNPENLDSQFAKAEKFIKWLREKDKDLEDLHHTLYHILIKYPYDEWNKDEIGDKFQQFKKGDIYRDEYLLEIKGKYQGKKESGQLSDIELEVFTAILEYLNKFELD